MSVIQFAKLIAGFESVKSFDEIFLWISNNESIDDDTSFSLIGRIFRKILKIEYTYVTNDARGE